VGKGCRSEGDSESNIGLADYRETSQITGRLRRLQGDFADYRETSQILNLKNRGKVTLLARARVF
jgi:hypothetical protein